MANTSLPNKTKKPFTQPDNRRPDNWTSEQMSSSEQTFSGEQTCSGEHLSSGGAGVKDFLISNSIYTYTAPQKNSVLKGLLPTRASLTVYHKMSVYDFSFMIPFILYSLKELRLGLNCPMKLLPYGTQSITRNLGLYTYTKYFL